MRQKSILLAIAVLSFANTNAQISYGGKPPSWRKLKSYSQAPIVKMTEIDTNKLKTSEKEFFKSKTITHCFPVEINPANSGEWKTLEDGSKVWRVGIQSIGAYSLFLNFEPFELPQGAKLFLYDQSKRYLLGSYTHENNRKSRIFPVEPIPGELAYVELVLPPGMDNNYMLNINRVGHDYVDFFKYLNNNSLLDTKGCNNDKNCISDKISKSGECNHDINCVNDEELQKVKNATFLYIYYHTYEKANKYCNGTLINNTRQNGKPYFLTAGHCVFDTATAASVNAIFDYDSYYCNGPSKPKTKTLSGSEFVATVNKLDFGLAQFPELPPANYRPYFAGWDRTGRTTNNVACIHHPLGDMKKVSFDHDDIELASYSMEYDDYSFYRINRWETGTTEPGSSGSPLYDTNYRIIGTLTGGDADCINPVNDYFTRFSYAWDSYPLPSQQLKYWLDPDNIGINRIDGMDPYEEYNESCKSLSNMEGVDLVNRKVSQGWGYWTGHNSQNITRYAQKFNIDSIKLFSGIIMNVAKSAPFYVDAYISLKIWADDFNKPGLELATMDISLAGLVENVETKVEFDTLILLNSNIFAGYEINYTTPADTFALYQTPTAADPSENYYVYKNGNWARIDKFTDNQIQSSLGLEVKLCDTIDIDKPSSSGLVDFKLLPVPANNFIIIDFGQNEIGNNNTINLSDISGNQLQVEIVPYAYNKYKLDLANQPSGFYILYVRSEKDFMVKKFVIQK